MKKTFYISLCALVSSCSAVRTDYSNATLKKGQLYYYLPESMLKVTVNTKVMVSYGPSKELLEDQTIVEQSVLIDSEIIADTDNMLSLQYQPNALFNDEIKFGINNKGLLETVDVTTDDRTPEIIKILSEAPGTIMGVTLTPKSGEGYTKIVEYKNEFKLRYASLKDETELKIVLNIVNENDVTKVLFLDADVKLIKQTTASTLGSTTYENEETSLTIPYQTDSKTEKEKLEKNINGILTRPLKNVDFVIDFLNFPRLNGEDFIKSLPITVSVMDTKKMFNVPITRASFVKKTNKIVLSNGIVTSNEIKKPSSVEGFLSIPINIAKAIVSVPAQLVQLKIDTTTRNKNLETAVKDLNAAMLENEKLALSKENELEKIKIQIQKDSLTRNYELEKLKNTLETELATTKIALAEAKLKLKELEDKINGTR